MEQLLFGFYFQSLYRSFQTTFGFPVAMHKGEGNLGLKRQLGFGLFWRGHSLLCSGIILGRAWRTKWGAGIKPRSAACKLSTLPAVVSPTPYLDSAHSLHPTVFPFSPVAAHSYQCVALRYFPDLPRVGMLSPWVFSIFSMIDACTCPCAH